MVHADPIWLPGRSFKLPSSDGFDNSLVKRNGTVGAQSIARAQSIAHGHIGDIICKKN
jgi:hypothetical protein